MKIVGMIPARSGSKGLPGKNLRLVAGKPMLAHSVIAAQECSKIDTVFLNSDSEEYLSVGAIYGAEGYLRKPSLASDSCSMRDVVVDFAEFLNKQKPSFGAIVVLYPTYPTRTHQDIEKFVGYFLEHGAERPVIGFKEPRTHPYMTYHLSSEDLPTPVLPFDIDQYYRRQDYPHMWELTAWACVLPFEALRSLNAQLMNSETLAYRVPKDCDAIDVDTIDDLYRADRVLTTRLQK